MAVCRLAEGTCTCPVLTVSPCRCLGVRVQSAKLPCSLALRHERSKDAKRFAKAERVSLCSMASLERQRAMFLFFWWTQ